MDVWLTYTPRDFLLFSAETYWRLFALTNEALWPLPLLSTGVAAVLLALALGGPARARLLLGPVAAVGWTVVALAFLRARYEPINWAIAWVWPAFLVEAAVLVLLVLPLARPSGGLRRACGTSLLLLAIAYPLVGFAAGRPPGEAEVVGIAPDPTAIATLGLVSLARGRLVALAAPIPILWLVIGTTTLTTMDEATSWVPLAALVLGTGSLLLPGRPTGAGGGDLRASAPRRTQRGRNRPEADRR